MSSHTPAPDLNEQIDDPESGWTWFVSLASIVILIVTVVAVTELYFVFKGAEVAEKVIDRPSLEMTQLRAEQKAVLDVYERYSVIPIGGTEEDAEVRIRIPIEKAMEIMEAMETKNQSARTQAVDSASDTIARVSEESNR